MNSGTGQYWDESRIGGNGLETMLRLHTSARVPAAFEKSLLWEFGMRAFGRARRTNEAEANITFINYQTCLD